MDCKPLIFRYDLQNNAQKAIQAYGVLLTVIPTSPSVLVQLAKLFVSLGDAGQAFHYYSEAHRYFPCDVEVCAWIGAYYVECGVFEQAIGYFERADVLEVNVKWGLAVANCKTKCGAVRDAYDGLIILHLKFPENIECTVSVSKLMRRS